MSKCKETDLMIGLSLVATAEVMHTPKLRFHAFFPLKGLTYVAMGRTRSNNTIDDLHSARVRKRKRVRITSLLF